MTAQRMVLYVAGAVFGVTCLFRLKDLFANLPWVIGSIAFAAVAFWYLTKVKVIKISDE